MSLISKIAPDRHESSDLKVGIEVEYPLADGDPMKNEAQSSSSLFSRMNEWPLRGRYTNDPSVGLEVVSDPPLDVDDVVSWYSETIDYIESEYNATYAPTGMLHGSTAGLHTHVSPLTRDEAETLHEWSSEPWLQVFVCSSVCETEAPYYRVFRDNYCRLNRSVDGGDRYAVVNERSRTDGHYEWRLPEPMTEENLDRMMEFLKIFKYSPEKAKEYALEAIEKEDNITSIKRADAIGVELAFGDEGEVTRSAADHARDFWNSVQNDESCPYIYRVITGDGQEYYAFESRRNDYFTIEGVRFNRESVIDTQTMIEVSDNSRAYSEVQEILESRNGPNPKEATKFLKDVMKKKKQ